MTGKREVIDMTTLLQQAFTEASKLSVPEQDSFAQFLLAELEAERQWAGLFARSADLLEKMADEALAEDAAGSTEALDPDGL